MFTVKNKITGPNGVTYALSLMSPNRDLVLAFPKMNS